MAQVKLVNLCKRFPGVIAVNNVTLEIKDKEFLVLVGPSGCGKNHLPAHDRRARRVLRRRDLDR